MVLTTVIVNLSLLLIPFTLAQTVAPGLTHDCSQETFYVGDLACNNDQNTCCGPTETCCAGGCCAYNAVCVFPGTANEGCCIIGTQDNCGYNPDPSSGSGSCSTSGASIPCSGLDSSWYCAAHCTCNDSVDMGCNCLTGCDDSSSSSSSIEAAASSTDSPNAAATTSSEEFPESTTTSEFGIQGGTSSSTSAARMTGTIGGVESGSSTTADTPASTTTKASVAPSAARLEALTAIVVGIAAWILPTLS